jgi:uncharacterized secreted protein with C-terminal beta-propeller domain
MKWFKCGSAEIGLKEIDSKYDNRIQAKFILKLNGEVIYTSDDLQSGMYSTYDLKDMANLTLDFMVCGDFLPSDIRQKLENSIEYDFENEDDQDARYYLEEIN